MTAGGFSSAMTKVVVGLAVVVMSPQIYSSYVNSIPVFGGGNLSTLEHFGYLVLGLIAFGLLSVGLGLRQLLREVRQKSGSAPSTLRVIAQVLGERKYSRMLMIFAVLYATFFAIVSGIIVYRPAEDFAQEYFAQIPSTIIAVCCGGPGMVPVLTIFVTNHFAILLIPANVLILITVSLLVGLNVTLVICEYYHRPQTASSRWLLGLGAFTGLFTACPTCAGLFFSAIVVALGSSALIILPSWQLYFIIGTVIVLAVGIYLSTRRLAGRVLATVNPIRHR